MTRRLFPVCVFGLLLSAPAASLAQAPAEGAVSVRARITVSRQEVAENTARGLATPVGIATGDGDACEVRCVLADDAPAPGPDGTEVLQCELGDVRRIDGGGVDVLVTWSDGDEATFVPIGVLDLRTCG